MGPTFVILLALVIVYVGASGRWEDIFKALTKKK